MQLAPAHASTAHASAAHAFVYDMLGDAAVFDRNYSSPDHVAEEDAIQSGEVRFTRSGRVPSSIQAILQGRKSPLSDGERSAASTHGTNTPTTIPWNNGEASWLDRTDRRKRFDMASPQNSPIKAVPKSAAARADFAAFIAAVREATDSHEPQDDAPEMRLQEEGDTSDDGNELVPLVEGAGADAPLSE
ncbi:hypothetical protein T484DRAFT_1906558 [Baffinella frigidus]|nr:hypothetical protein T484DRAFT_1906558 [Cryptophyta sp. CCMP2293]